MIQVFRVSPNPENFLFVSQAINRRQACQAGIAYTGGER
jgi:hypothetical protein